MNFTIFDKKNSKTSNSSFEKRHNPVVLTYKWVYYMHKRYFRKNKKLMRPIIAAMIAIKITEYIAFM